MSDGAMLLIVFMLCITLCYCMSEIVEYFKSINNNKKDND